MSDQSRKVQNCYMETIKPGLNISIQLKKEYVHDCQDQLRKERERREGEREKENSLSGFSKAQSVKEETLVTNSETHVPLACPFLWPY